MPQDASNNWQNIIMYEWVSGQSGIRNNDITSVLITDQLLLQADDF